MRGSWILYASFLFVCTSVVLLTGGLGWISWTYLISPFFSFMEKYLSNQGCERFGEEINQSLT